MSNLSTLFSLFRNSLFYGFGSLIQKSLSVLLIPIYTHYLQPSDFGIISLLTLTTMILCTLTMLGLTNGISRYYYYSSNENVSKSEIIWSPLILILFLSFTTISILIFFVDPIGLILLSSVEYKYLITFSLINVLIINLTDVARSVMIFEEKVLFVNLVNIAGVISSASYGIISVILFGRGVSGVIEAGLLGSITMCSLCIFFSLRHYKPSFSQKILKKQLRFSLPLMLAVFAFLIIDASDRYMLRLFLPIAEVGLYNLGYQIGMVVFLIVGGFSLAWPPFYHKNNLEGNAQELCGKVLNIFVSTVGLFVVLLCIFSPLAINVLTPPTYHEIYKVVPFIALAIFMRGPYEIFIMGVVMKNKTSWQLYLEVFVASLNIVLNYLLIQNIGREGAAVSTLMCYVAMSFGALLMVQKINPIGKIKTTKIFFGLIVIYFFSLSILIKDIFINDLQYYFYILIFFFTCYLFVFNREISIVYKFFARRLNEE